jgi:hypothetical protein
MRAVWVVGVCARLAVLLLLLRVRCGVRVQQQR